jgi:hypothetical protein
MPHPRLRQTDPNTITIDLGHQEPDGGLGDLLEILHLVCHRHEYLGDDPPNEDLAPPAHTPQGLNDTTGRERMHESLDRARPSCTNANTIGSPSTRPSPE